MEIDSDGRAPGNKSTGMTRRSIAACLVGGAILAASDQPAGAAPTAQIFTPALIDVRQYGAVGDGRVDDADALQHAIDAALASGRRVYLPAGRYRVTRSLVWETTRRGGQEFGSGLRMSGDGPTRSVIVAVCPGPALLIDAAGQTTGPADHQFDQGLHLSDFGVAGAHPESVGLYLRGQWYGTIERCRLSGLGRHGLVIGAKALNPDWYITAGLRVIGCDISNNGGWGVTAEAALAMVVPRFERCRIAVNREGGMDFNGAGLELLACAIAGNGVWVDGVPHGGGVWLRNRNDGVPNDFFRIEACEFDLNREYHVRLDYCTTGAISRNRFLAKIEAFENRKTVSPPVSLSLSAERPVIRSLEIRQNIWVARGDLASAGLRHEFIVLASPAILSGAARIRLAGSAFRLDPGISLGRDVLTFADEDMSGETAPLPGAGSLALRPLYPKGVLLLRVGAEAGYHSYDCVVGEVAPLRSSAAADAEASDTSFALRAEKGGLLVISSFTGHSRRDWSIRFLA